MAPFRHWVVSLLLSTSLTACSATWTFDALWTVDELLGPQHEAGLLPQGVIGVTTALPVSDTVGGAWQSKRLVGQGSYVPDQYLAGDDSQISWQYRRRLAQSLVADASAQPAEPLPVPTPPASEASPPSAPGGGGQPRPVAPDPMVPPPWLPPSPALPPPPLPPFTLLVWARTSPVITLSQGQELSLSSLSLYASQVEEPLGPVPDIGLANLAPSGMFAVPAGATLRLSDVTLVLHRTYMRSLHSQLCAGILQWPYDPGLTMRDGNMRITSLTTTTNTSPETGGGGGGTVVWTNVTVLCACVALDLPLACSSRAVGGESGDAAELLAASTEQLMITAGPVVLYVTEDAVLRASDDVMMPVLIMPQSALILKGDPQRPPTLDLSGLPDVWTMMELQSSPDVDASTLMTFGGSRYVAFLHDLLLVNLPGAAWPHGPLSLMASAVSTFRIPRGVSSLPNALLQLTRCTLVVPDGEVAFLRDVASRNSSQVLPGAPDGSFQLALQQDAQQQQSMAPEDPLPAPLAVLRLQLLSEALLVNCTLVPASSYSATPGAAPLLPQTTVWSLGLAAPADPDTASTWGLGGLEVAAGLQPALNDLATWISRADYNPSRILWRVLPRARAPRKR